MEKLKQTVFYDRHASLGAKIVEFGGWAMPLEYGQGIVHEHLTTRKGAGLFDVSHMGRFVLRGDDALPFLQHVLTNNAAALEAGESQYTLVPNAQGGAIDDAYLYRFLPDEYLLVVNAANREAVWNHFREIRPRFGALELVDRTTELAMISLQGPRSKDVLTPLIQSGVLPEPRRNALSVVTIRQRDVFLARTGYTGEPICFELFIPVDAAGHIWDLLIAQGAEPVGLGARDTLRLESGLPLYGHELGRDPEDLEIPIFASPLAQFAVSFSPLKGDFIGREALRRQFDELKDIIHQTCSDIHVLTRRVMPVALIDKGIARAGNTVFLEDRPVGWVTSGTMVPYWHAEGEGISSRLTEEKGRRAIALALLDSRLKESDVIEIDIRGRKAKAIIVPHHLKSDVPPYARAILPDALDEADSSVPLDPDTKDRVGSLLQSTVANTVWRQQMCVNLIPSEQTPSRLTRMLSIMDPVGRYAEHKPVKGFNDAEVFYYQGTDFISEVERLLQEELTAYLGCAEVETRIVSGQMANAAVFSALVDYLNRADRKQEPRRIGKVLNHHIIKGGHLSAQPMGALKDFVARNPKTEKPAVVHFPVLPENPYKVDVAACREIMAAHRPELIILGRSMTIHREPVAEVRSIIDELGLSCVLMYDMAHVLGLAGPYFQQPFEEGADIVTASTHKTYYGTQRGIVAADYMPEDPEYLFWETVQRRAFPGSVSNHHLGSLLGLLMATYEMNHFKNDYQKQVLENAKSFAAALKETGMDVAGDPGLSYTETHQVILNVGYAKGPEAARRLEESNIIVNYQASPEEEGFTASGSLRMGVSEMTRFGMMPEDFAELAELIHDVVVKGKIVKDAVSDLRKRFQDMMYCFSEEGFEDPIQKLYQLI
jgi:glycine cleavage system T protein